MNYYRCPVHVLHCFLLLMLVACGADTAASSPAHVADQWYMAMRSVDRQQALALTADFDFRASAVDRWLAHMQEELFPQPDTPFSTGGNLGNVSTVRSVGMGSEQHVYSRWSYATRTQCHDLVLVHTERGWRARSWGDALPETCNQ